MLEAIKIPVSQQLTNLDPDLLKMITVLASVWIRFVFKADPDPVFIISMRIRIQGAKRVRMDPGQF